MDYYKLSISAKEFQQFKFWLHSAAGIDLKETKTKLVEGRLASRLRHYNLSSYGEYFNLLTNDHSSAETQVALDLLTTNETYFFREPDHFDFLTKHILSKVGKNKFFRLWCAASSSGEEPYTLAMTLAESLGMSSWEIIASDINSQVLAKARSGHYPLSNGHNIARSLLEKYCLKGHGPQQGTFLFQRPLREKIAFKQINLINRLPEMGSFDVVFLRNVMIYFDSETKQQVVARIVERLKPGGYLFVSHSESLIGINAQLKIVKPSIFMKV